MHAAGNSYFLFWIDLKFGVPGLERALAGQPGALRAPEARPLQNKPAPAWRWIKAVCQLKTSRSQMIPNCGILDFQPICHGNSKQVTVASKWASRNDF